MKKTFLIIAFISLFTQVLVSQNLITVQNGVSSSFYTSLDLAITNALAGDTIYIPGGGHTITNPIDKELHLVGAGCNADSTIAAGITITNAITLKTGADGGSIEGIYINGNIKFGYSDASDGNVNGYYIQRCYLNGGIWFLDVPETNHSTNISVVETTIYFVIGNQSFRGSTSGFINIQNCKIYGRIQSLTQSLAMNNIFYYYDQWSSELAFGGTNCTLKNNIFFDPGFMYGTNSTFLNNIGVLNNGVYGNNNFGSGNVTEIWEDTFVDPANGDYHLKATSIGNNAGTDGTDIGIYGGAFPWKEGSVPFNPHFQTVQIAPTTDESGNLNVNIKVAAQDH